ncbi:M48 family metallopeptidase [uncultured Desulfuromonas sp.]|uniref:M48 family metallopeptidase n=1 Tax=uncultured Desulfuromonas sp. TaxID=181013 RepID=UPI002AAA80D1|nr:M48 family metallopeptidase [uncultured Desulfuromonas sp.]
MTMASILFTIILVVLVADYVVERVVDVLNARWMGHAPPAELHGLYDAEKYRRQQNYQRVTTRFNFITSTFSLVLVVVFLSIDGFAWLHGLAVQLSGNGIIQALLFFGVLWLAQDLLSTPFDLYQTFSIEQRFGFNTMDGKTFVTDKLKAWLLTVILGGAILAGIAWFYYQTKALFWLYSWITVTGFSLFFTLFYSNLIVPLFNKQTKLEEGELKTAIEDFSSRVDFPVKDIYVLDGSKRSTKANAYFTGLGAKKRIVLFDTLIRDLSPEEVVAVLAHEIGHYQKKHTLQGMVLSIAQTGVIFYLMSLFLEYALFCQALGVDQAVFHVGLVAFALLYSPISLVTGLLMHMWSRHNEYQADAFAVQYHDAESLINALKKLSVNHLSNLTPHPAYVFFHYSHPSLYQRIRAMRHLDL